MKKFLWLWGPVVIWCGVIFWLSSISSFHTDALRWGIRNRTLEMVLHKIAHLIEYGTLARLFARALTGSTFWSWKRIFYVSLLLSILYGASDEFHQRFVMGREGKVSDVVVDGICAWLGLGMIP